VPSSRQTERERRDEHVSVRNEQRNVIDENSTDSFSLDLLDKLLLFTAAAAAAEQRHVAFALLRHFFLLLDIVVFHIKLSFLFCNQNKEHTRALISLLL
jgi:hypothetical protein